MTSPDAIATSARITDARTGVARASERVPQGDRPNDGFWEIPQVGADYIRIMKKRMICFMLGTKQVGGLPRGGPRRRVCIIGCRMD
jgi:hypothetical protein